MLWAEPKGIELVAIENAIANTIVKHHHYLHRARTGGPMLSYLVMQAGVCVGTIIFASPTFIQKKGLIPPLEPGQVVELARLWLVDGCPKNTASQAVAAALKRIGQDWKAYRDEDVRAVVAFSDLRFGHEGNIYKACNFQDFGFASMARFDEAGTTYTRTGEGYGIGHYSERTEKVACPRSHNTKRCYVYWLLRRRKYQERDTPVCPTGGQGAIP